MAEQLRFDLFANDRASAGFAAAGRSAQAAADDVMGLAMRLDEVDRKSAEARVGLTGNKEALLELDKLDYKLHVTGRKVTPEITLDGFAKAMLQVSTLDVALDKLNDKNAKPDAGTGGSLISRLFGGGSGSAAGSAGSGSGSAGSGLVSAIASNPYTATGAVAAIAAGLPFAAQAAAGAITFGLGGALAGIGVYAEKGVRSVQYQFAQLWSGKDGIQDTLANISPAFGQALTTILSAARTFVPQFIRDFGPALDAIAGPLKAFGVELAGTLASPQVATSLKETGKAFGSILSALTPAIPGIATAVSDGFTNIARAVAKNPKAFADFISGIAHVIAAALDVIAWLTQVAAYLELHFLPAFSRAGQFFTSWGHDIEHTFDNVRTFVTVTVARLVGDVVAWFATLPHRTLNALSGWGTGLENFGRQALSMLLDGVKSAAGPIFSWFGGFVSKILGFFSKLLHNSPTGEFYAMGRNMMEGLAMGLKDHAHLVSNAVTGHAVPDVGAGVARWAGLVRQALSMEGLPAGYLPLVLYQMQTESGGNPDAQNNTDINAQRGDPSRGLLQTIGSTFASFHWPGTSWNIFDPLANIAAALNYGAHNGRGFGSGPGQIGSGHGYDQGGLLPPGLSLAWNATGRAEVVAPGGMGRVEALLGEVNDRLAQLTDVAAAAPATTGAALGAALAGGARAATYRALYS